MAGRPHRTAVADPVREAKRQLEAVNRKVGRHVTMCYRCAHAGQHTERYCDAGWQLAKDQARASAAVRRAEHARAQRPVQGELW